MAETLGLRHQLLQSAEALRDLLRSTSYTPPESADVSVKSALLSLLPSDTVLSSSLRAKVRDFALCCALLSSAASSTSPHFAWIPGRLSISAEEAFREISGLVYGNSEWEESKQVAEFGVDLRSVVDDSARLAIDLLPDLLLVIKDTIKNSSISGDNDGDEISAASASTPVAYAILAAHQLSWFVSQIQNPHLGRLSVLIIPCGLTALDHWSSEVKEQGMVSFIHLGKNVNASDLGCFRDVILDACYQNIVSPDEIWRHAVEMCVLFISLTQRNNPRSPWTEKIMNEMIGHLERKPRDKERRVAWLELIDPLLHSAGLVLLVHFRRLFPLLFQWMHADDDETLLLVLKRTHTVIKVTWIRNTPYIFRLVDALTVVYKEAATRVAREEIRSNVNDVLVLLQQCKGVSFEYAWEKYKDDPNLGALGPTLSRSSGTTESKEVQ